MIRAFVFDIGNVLLKFDFNLALGRILPRCGKRSLSDFAPVEAIKNAYEGGRISRADFLREAFALLEYAGEEAEFVAAWEDIFEENAPMIGLVESLHGAYPLYLLSNTSDIHMDYIVKRYPVFSRFSDGVYSYLAGCSKPSLEIYELAARQFGVAPGETAFIDDLPANVAAAREAGFRAFQYDFRDHAALLSGLEKEGVTLSAPR